MSDEIVRYGFDGLKPTPANPVAIEFAQKISDMLLYERDLGDAMLKVPDYTGQWERSDYYASQQENYNRSVDDLWNFVKENVNG